MQPFLDLSLEPPAYSSLQDSRQQPQLQLQQDQDQESDLPSSPRLQGLLDSSEGSSIQAKPPPRQLLFRPQRPQVGNAGVHPSVLDPIDSDSPFGLLPISVIYQ